ncbi:response regulator transcription factor [Thalassotalea ponticola]|uniref:response regulator transcription factor n=1 Tax=Thalassotalea ponticola TaxID=1523392 RepID=UPI0025B3FF3F|nr:response regulator transcription factor [Thalassotalea ponticola]MDN3651830.1 response regulator transcription factor [Thalassotalea ponticola]
MQTHDSSILLIEDDIPLANLIKTYLESNRCSVTHIARGLDVKKLANDRQFDLVVCDVMLPDIDGFRLQPILQKKLSCEVIFLTAINEDNSHIKGLELGAIDYIVKPVEPKVLLARIRANLRKSLPHVSLDMLKLGDLVLDRKRKVIEYQGKPLELTDNDFDLMWIFSQHQGEPLSREFLFQAVVGREYNGLDRIIDARTMRLRKKISDFNIPGLSISTLWGKGYLFTYTQH